MFGKSYYKDRIVERLGFDKLKIITTRPKREGEKNGEDKIFVNKDELQILRNSGKIAFEFELLGVLYAYTKEELFSSKNLVFELHYDTIFDFKKVCPDMKVIYLFPQNLEIAKEKTRARHLDPITEEKRLFEIDEHYKRITTDENLKEMFDYILYNNYDKDSEEIIINFVKDLLEKNKQI